jgi:DNA-binding response OmpR family regulator
MTKLLLVSDTPWVRDEVHAALTMPEFSIIDHDDSATAGSTAVAEEVAAAVVDLQVGSMGGLALVRSIRDASMKAGSETPVVLLLDRAADAFIAKRAGAAAWVTKPVSSHELQTAVRECLVASDA